MRSTMDSLLSNETVVQKFAKNRKNSGVISWSSTATPSSLFTLYVMLHPEAALLKVYQVDFKDPPAICLHSSYYFWVHKHSALMKKNSFVLTESNTPTGVFQLSGLAVLRLAFPTKTNEQTEHTLYKPLKKTMYNRYPLAVFQNGQVSQN